MSKKLEKLREVNMQLNSLIGQMETKMFIENIFDIKDVKPKETKPQSVVVQKH
jgi:hypothetical protein